MSRGKELTKNTIIVTIGKIATQFLTFFLLPLYTSQLSTEEYGYVDLITTYINLLVPIIILEIQQGIFRYLIDVRNNEKEKEKLISTTICIAIIQSIVYLIVYGIISYFIKFNYQIFIATNVIAMIFSSIMLQIARGEGDNKTYTIASFVTAISSIILNIVFVAYLKIGAYGILLSVFISNVLCSIYVMLKLKIYKKIKIKLFNKDKLMEMVKYSIPLIPNEISWWIMSTSDRTIISVALGVAENGIYSVANKFSSIITTLYTIFNITWVESASLHINDEDAEQFFSEVIDIVFRLFSSLCFGLITILPFMYFLLIDKKFSEAYTQIPILVYATLCNVIIILISGIYIAKKMTKKVARTSIIAAIINIIVNIALIQYIGIYAASISTLISSFIVMMIRVKDIKKIITISFNKKIITITIIMAIVLLIMYYTQNMITNIIALGLTIIYTLSVNKIIFKTIFKTIKERIL